MQKYRPNRPWTYLKANLTLYVFLYNAFDLLSVTIFISNVFYNTSHLRFKINFILNLCPISFSFGTFWLDIFLSFFVTFPLLPPKITSFCLSTWAFLVLHCFLYCFGKGFLSDLCVCVFVLIKLTEHFSDSCKIKN